jgi:NADP-dependent 3-hydroxy acid dehydrogenase YdfG
VTGGSRGIGAAVAESLADAGAAVHVLTRDPEAVRATARASGGDAWRADLEDDAEVWDALEALSERIGGPPHAVVSSAGAFELARLADTSVASFDRHLAVNLRGSFLVLRVLLPAFLDRGSGHIVHVGSIAGRRGFAENGAYSASKYGLRGLHEVLLEELRGSGVAATLLEPAATDTSLWDAVDPDAREDLPDRAAMLRPADVAAAVRFVLTRPPHVRIPLMQIERG